jgi:uncharacterized protein YkwD
MEMGRRDSDDWRGWKDGKYDNRYSRNSRRNRNKTKSVTVGIVFLLIIGVFGFILFDQGYLDASIESAPKEIQDVSKTVKEIVTETTKTAKKVTTETTEKLSETINEQLEKVQIEPIEVIVDDIKNIPKTIQDKNPINQKPVINKIQLEEQVHKLTNQYRIQNGLNALSWDDKLSNIARSHSEDMASRNYFAHDTPEGKDPTDRGTSQGYICQKAIGNLIYSGIAENIFQNNLYDTVWYTNDIPTSYDWNTLDELAYSTVDGWMNSPGHRENILTKTIDKEGIGVAFASDDKVYITQNFC